MAFNPELMKKRPRITKNSSHTGRPSSLSKTTLAEIELLYQHNIPAVAVARKYSLSRQQVYYYYKTFELRGVECLPVPTIESVLKASKQQECDQQLNKYRNDHDRAYA